MSESIRDSDDIENELLELAKEINDADIEEKLKLQSQKSHDEINQELLDLIRYRTQKNWFATAAVVSIFGAILTIMMIQIALGIDIQTEWKEILLIMLGAFVGSWGKVIYYWFSNSEADNALLQEGTTKFNGNNR